MKNILTLLILFCAAALNAQDVIYKKDNTKIEAKILEINQSEVRYKMFANPDGPLYIMYKSDVVKIVYPSGQVEIYNPEIKKEEPQIVKDDYVATTSKPKDDDSFNKDLTRNVVSVNLIQAMLGYASISYEWVERNGMFGIKIPVGYSFGDEYAISLPNLFYDQQSEYFGGLAFNIYPKRKKRVSYVVGPYLQVGQLSYEAYQSYTYKTYHDGMYYAFYINNGMEVLLGRDLSFSFCGGPGIIRKITPHDTGNNGFDFPVSLNGELNLSYRF